MMDPDMALAVTQANVQYYFASSLENLMLTGADQIAWDEWIASVRFSSEETWFRCNAFLLAHTLARFLARSASTDGEGPRDPWLDAFVAAVASGDVQAELVLWPSATVDNPVANDAVRYSAVLWSMCQALRTSRPLDGPRPGLFSEPVWFGDAGLVVSIGDEFD